MPKNRELTESERTTISNGLRIAAGKFHEHVKMFRDDKDLGISADAAKRLQDQFQTQCDESVALADLIDNAESLTIVEGEESASDAVQDSYDAALTSASEVI